MHKSKLFPISAIYIFKQEIESIKLILFLRKFHIILKTGHPKRWKQTQTKIWWGWGSFLFYFKFKFWYTKYKTCEETRPYIACPVNANWTVLMSSIFVRQCNKHCSVICCHFWQLRSGYKIFFSRDVNIVWMSISKEDHTACTRFGLC